MTPRPQLFFHPRMVGFGGRFHDSRLQSGTRFGLTSWPWWTARWSPSERKDEASVRAFIGRSPAMFCSGDRPMGSAGCQRLSMSTKIHWGFDLPDSLPAERRPSLQVFAQDLRLAEALSELPNDLTSAVEQGKFYFVESQALVLGPLGIELHEERPPAGSQESSLRLFRSNGSTPWAELDVGFDFDSLLTARRRIHRHHRWICSHLDRWNHLDFVSSRRPQLLPAV